MGAVCSSNQSPPAPGSLRPEAIGAFKTTGQAAVQAILPGPERQLFTSLSSAGTVVNQVKDLFNGLGQLTAEYEAISGAVNTSTTPYVGYAYNVPTNTSSATNNARPISVTYPNGRKIDYVYNSGLDTAISRISALTDDVSGTPSSTPLEAYTYLGLGSIVERNHPQSSVNLSYINSSATTGNRYSGLDAFGRIIDQNWTKTSTSTAVDRFQYAYDRVGDVLYKNDLVVPANSELYQANGTASNSAYDPLGRITAFKRGTLSASGSNGSQLDQVSSSSANGSWTYDALGNWTSQTTGSSTISRTFNAQNQTATTGSGTLPVYDRNGNEVVDAQGYRYTYNAWNQPVSVVAASGKVFTTQGSYSYDALGRRIVASYPSSSGAPIKNLYYSPDGQVIEERWGSNPVTSAVQYQYVWSLDGVNTLVLRDQYSSGSISQRLYVEQDANGNVTSLTDTSGNAVARFLYDPYGNVTFMNAAGTSAATPVAWDYLFQGGRRDSATGRVSFGARDYIPFEGKWAQRDPIGFAGGSNNIYEFVGSNPVAYTDVTGLKVDPEPAPTRSRDDRPGGLAGVMLGVMQWWNGEDARGEELDDKLQESRNRQNKYLDPLNPQGGKPLSLGSHKRWDGSSTDDAVKRYEDVVGNRIPRRFRDALIEEGLQAAAGPVAGRLAKGAKKAAKLADEADEIFRSMNKRVRFKDMEVRAVRDLSHLSEGTLRTMSEKGFAARDRYGKPLQLHHLGQNPAGPLVEIPDYRHDISNRVQHPLGNARGVGLTPEQRLEFDGYRNEYWKARAREELRRRGLMP